MRVFALVLLLAVTASPSDKYIPHIAQGGGWSTSLQVFNTCENPVESFEINFYGRDGSPKQFTLDGIEGTTSRIYNTVPLDKNGAYARFTNLDGPAVSGYGILNDPTGCISMDIVYTQEGQDGGVISYATVPPQRQAEKHVMPFFSFEGCETSLALAGMQQGARILATNAATGEVYGEYSVPSGVSHIAFKLSDVIPRIAGEGIGGAHIYGKAAMVGLDFCEGVLVQFRLPHAAPERGMEGGDGATGDGSHINTEWTASESDNGALRSYAVKVTGKKEYSFETYFLVGVNAVIGRTGYYNPSLELLDEDGFLVRRENLGNASVSLPFGGTKTIRWTVEVGSDYVGRATSAVVVLN